VTEDWPAEVVAACEFLGSVSDGDKASLLASVDVYVAPNTGGESFGIILIEAMSAGACVLASDLSAFSRVLDGGRAGAMFANEQPDALARTLVDLLRRPERRAELAEAGQQRARIFDWSVVADEILAVYETVIEGRAAAVPAQGRWNRFLRGGAR
jgi:phosphatidyl-myo-inositol alpha-mannosyltransferase